MHQIDMPRHKTNIFLSHAREDFDRIGPIRDLLRNRSLSIWIDREKLIPGQDWELEIEKAIEESDLFLACFSMNSVSKTGFVQKERGTTE